MFGIQKLPGLDKIPEEEFISQLEQCGLKIGSAKGKINTKEISVAAATICGIFYAMARLNK